MKQWLAFLLVLVGILSYFLVSTQFGWYQRYPIVHFLIALLGLALLFRFLRAKFTYTGVVLNLFGWMVFLLFVWFTLFLSTYKATGLDLKQGESVAEASADLTLLDNDGKDFPFLERMNDHRANLIVFYRGYW